MKKIFFYETVIIFLLVFLSFSTYVHFVQPFPFLDGASVYYPAQKIIEENNLNFWNPLNNEYNTYYFKLPFTDEVIFAEGKSYPMQTLVAILIYSFIMKIFDYNAFFYINPVFGAMNILITYLICRKLVSSRLVAIISCLIAFSTPVILYWSVFQQTIVPATTFLLLSIFYLINFAESDKNKHLFFSGLFLGISIFIRPAFLVLALIYPIYLFNKVENLKKCLRKNFYFVLPIIVIFIFVSMLRLGYFGDPFFEGYLRTDYHPVSSTIVGNFTALISVKYFSLSIEPFLNSLKLFMIGSQTIFFPLIWIAVLGSIVQISKNEIKKYKLFLLLIITISIIYFGNMEPLLWKPLNPEWKYSLSLSFFRYLLPIYFLLIVVLAIVIDSLFKLVKNRHFLAFITFFLVIFSTVQLERSINYEGGASLNWLKEISEKIMEYQKELPSLLENGSIILYAERWELYFTYPNNANYNYLYYDGIPPSFRLVETKRIVESLLKDNRTVYFSAYDEAYASSILIKIEPDDPKMIDVENYLKNYFDFKYIEGSEFNRMKVKFYKINSKDGKT